MLDKVNVAIVSVLLLYAFFFLFSGSSSTFHKLHLDRVDSLPVYSADGLTDVDEFDVDCRWSNCWDVFNCSTLTVHTPPLEHYSTKTHGQVTPAISREFYQFYKWLSESKYFSANPASACIRIPPIDLFSLHRVKDKEKAIGALLKKQPHWNQGRNTLILSFNRQPQEHWIPSGQAVLASSGLTDSNLRFDFDIPVSFYSHFLQPIASSNQEKFKTLKREYDLVLVGTYRDDIERSVRDLMSSNHPNFKILSLKPCLGKGPADEICDQFQTRHKLPEVFAAGRFCLVSFGHNGYFQSSYFAGALGTGCVPVVIASGLLLPFQNKIDWANAAFRFLPEDIGTQLVPFLTKFDREEWVDFRDRDLFLFQKFFSSMEAVGEGLMSYLSDRLFPHQSLGYEYWNGPQPGVHSPLFMNRIAPDEGFTSVILAYDRIESLFRVIQSVAKAPSLRKILVVWNNQKKEPPGVDQWPAISVPLRIIKTTKNVLSNRFYPYDEIETNAVLSIDDDIVMLTPDEIQFGYQAWREFPDRLVGYPPRLHLWESAAGKHRYESEWTNEVSIILTGASFYHKYYSHVYSHLTPANIRDWVDTHMNCEDILMNFVISNSTGKAPIKVSPRKKFRCLDSFCSKDNSISIDPGHMVERSECINFFAEQYGHMPLKPVQFRADPVLYKDNKDNVEKKYEAMGAL